MMVTFLHDLCRMVPSDLMQSVVEEGRLQMSVALLENLMLEGRNLMELEGANIVLHLPQVELLGRPTGQLWNK